MDSFTAKVETLGGLSRALSDAARESNKLIQSGAVVIEVRPGSRKRTVDQNARIHAMLNDIADQCDLNGHYYPMHVWKRLCVAQWLKETGERPLLLPSIDGSEIVVIYEKTSKLNTKQCADFIEWLFAFGAEQGVKWKNQAA